MESNAKPSAAVMVVERMDKMPEAVAPMRVALFDEDGAPVDAGGQGYGEATASSAGLMSAADKAKLDGIAQGANAYVLPSATPSAIGGVRQAAHVASAAGETVTAAEFEVLLDALEAAGVVAAS